MFPALALRLRLRVFLALCAAALVCYAVTPAVRILAVKIGAMDAPGESRRIHDHPIPRLGGLAILLGFLVGALPFSVLSESVRGILIGSVLGGAAGGGGRPGVPAAVVKLLCAAGGRRGGRGPRVRIQILTNPIRFAGRSSPWAHCPCRRRCCGSWA
jgi:UDP-GlcNAc:undecaprenyl-phosphate GlcNAc-1-phosphate transferase